MKRIRIGNGSGFWGDSLDAPIQLAESGRLNYLTLEYLAELTMSILALLRRRDPNAGYATDFIDVLDRLGDSLKTQQGLKIVTNAGGMNPSACATKAKETLAKDGASNANPKIRNCRPTKKKMLCDLCSQLIQTPLARVSSA